MIEDIARHLSHPSWSAIEIQVSEHNKCIPTKCVNHDAIQNYWKRMEISYISSQNVTVQYSTVQYSTVQHSTAQHSTAPFHVHYSTHPLPIELPIKFFTHIKLCLAAPTHNFSGWNLLLFVYLETKKFANIEV